jgi:prepilin-type N-terminal cleavage/methylation domain-containing protein
MQCRNTGFSLFELIVVLVLMGLVMSLVAPSVSSLSRRAQIDAEVQSLSQLIYQISVDAYSTQSSARLIFEGEELQILSNVSEDQLNQADSGSSVVNNEFTGNLIDVANQAMSEPVSDDSIQRFSFQYLWFSPTQVEVSSAGIYDRAEVIYGVTNDTTRALKLVGVIEQ